MNDWIAHVKQFQAMHGCSYKDALKGASQTYRKGSGLRSASKSYDPSNPQYHTLGGNLKRTSKAQLKRIIEALGDKAIAKMSGMGAIGDMLKRQAAETTAQLIQSGGDRASSEMTNRGTGMHRGLPGYELTTGGKISRINKAGKWEQFANATLRDAIDTAGKAGRVYYDTTSPLSQMGFGLKRHRKLKGKALMAAGY